MRPKIAYRLLLCLVMTCAATLPAVGQRPQRRRTAPQRQAASPAQSPSEAIARAYAEGLASDNFTPLWQHAPRYSFQVHYAVKDVPRSMWPDKIRAIQEQWLNEIRVDRQATNTYTRRPCWVYFRGGMHEQFIEARDTTAFFRVSYLTDRASPLFQHGELYRKLKEATIVMQLGTEQPECDIVEGTETDYPPPELTKERAFEIVKNFQLPIEDQPSVDFYYGMLQPPLMHYTEFIDILKKHGVEISNIQYLYGGLNLFNLRAPASWGTYRLPVEHWQGMRVYALAESRPVEVVDFEQKEEKIAVVTVRVTFKGCTPICELVRDLQSFDNKYKGDSLGIFWSTKDYEHWPEEQTRQVILYNDAYDSWSVRSYR